MEILINQTLASLVTNNHRAVTILEKYNLDFCCKGKRTLEEACHEKSIDAEAIAKEISSLSQSADNRLMPFTEMSVEQLISHILVKHHFYVKQSMPQIQYHAQKVAEKHGERFPYMREVFELFANVNQEMTAHMKKEEMVLFPRIKETSYYLLKKVNGKLPEGFISGPLQVMEAEHEKAGELMFRIRSLTDNYAIPAGACTTFKVCLAELKEFEEDLHQHVHLENNILFPTAERMARELNI